MTNDTPALIPLYKRTYLVGYAIVDPEDVERLSAADWTLSKAGYAVATSKTVFGGEVLMHRVIALPSTGLVVDHENGVRIDNRRANLRNCTQKQNMRNRRGHRSTTGYRGVTQDKRDGRFTAALTVDGTAYGLGRFPTAVEAARVYDAAARQLHEEYGVLNFPDEHHHADIDWVAYVDEKRRSGGHNRKLNQETARQIRAKLQVGAGLSELATEYGVSPACIHNIRTGASYRENPPEQLALALERVEKGESVTAVAESLKLSRFALQRAVKEKWGHVPVPTQRRRRSNAKLSAEQVHEIIRRAAGGEKQKDLAAEFGVKLATVNGYVRGRKRVQNSI